jgi:parallel beta-helix repeat protein
MLKSGDTGAQVAGRSSHVVVADRRQDETRITRKRNLIAALLGLFALPTSCSLVSTGGPPWSLEGVPLPNDENSIQRTIDRMSTVSARYDLTFLPGDREPPSLFALRPLGLEVYRVDADGHLGVGRESSGWGDGWKVAGIAVPMAGRGGLPGDTALGFLRDFPERVGVDGGRIEDEGLEPDDNVVWVATEMAGTHGFVWGAPASPWVFEAAAETKGELANLVRAFAEAARAANRDQAFSRAAGLAGSTLLVASDTTLRDDHQGSVEVEADDVTLDCAGHTISGPGTRAEDEYGFIGILLDGRTGVTVRNCRVSGFDYGILLTARLGSGSDGNRLIGNAVSGNRLSGVRINESEHNVLTANIASSNGRNGFVFVGSSNIVTGNQALDNEYNGFAVAGGRREIVFSRNISKGNRIMGFGVVGTGHTFLRNTAANNGANGFGITGESISVRRNRAARNGVDGFAIGRGSSSRIALYHNTSIGNQAHGFLILGAGHTFVRNTASENGLVGFAIDGRFGRGRNTFERNRATGNVVHGFQVAGSRRNTFIRNIASDNDAVGFSLELDSRGNGLYQNIARDNGEDGFRTMQDSFGNTFERNVALGNGWTGFRAEAGPNLFSDNRACENGVADAVETGSHNRWRNNSFCAVEQPASPGG